MTTTPPRMTLTAFSAGRRIVVNRLRRTVTVTGKTHIDRYPFEDATSRVKLYTGLRDKPKYGTHYVGALAAAQKAADLVQQAEGGRA